MFIFVVGKRLRCKHPCSVVGFSMTEVLAAEEKSNSCKVMTVLTLKRAKNKASQTRLLC